MNRNNKLLLGVLAFVVACTIGYALFSENIAITGTATAKGDFALTTTCKTGMSDFDPSVLGSLGLPNEAGYENDSCTVVGDTVTFHSDLLYPTATRYFTIKITNDGSIPAMLKLGSSDIIVDESSKICFYENGSKEASNCIGPEESTSSGISYWDFIGVSEYVFAAEVDGKIIIFDGDFTEEEEVEYNKILPNYRQESSKNDLVINPGVSVYFMAAVMYPEVLEGNGNLLFEANHKTRFNFVQQQAE